MNESEENNLKILLNKGITILIIVMMVMSFTSLFAYQDSYASADVTAPVIDTASLSVDKTSAVSGDTVKLSVKVTDDVAVSYVEVVYTTPQTNKWSMIYLSYDSTTGYYEKSISISDTTEAGSWTIQMITAADTSGNSVTYDGVSSLYGAHADLSKGAYNTSIQKRQWKTECVLRWAGKPLRKSSSVKQIQERIMIFVKHLIS